MISNITQYSLGGEPDNKGRVSAGIETEVKEVVSLLAREEDQRISVGWREKWREMISMPLNCSPSAARIISQTRHDGKSATSFPDCQCQKWLNLSCSVSFSLLLVAMIIGASVCLCVQCDRDSCF